MMADKNTEHKAITSEEEDIAEIAFNIRKLRQNMHLSRDGFSEKCTVDPGTVKRWESGQVCPDTRNILNMAVAFQADLADILPRRYFRKSDMWEGLGFQVRELPDHVREKTMRAIGEIIAIAKLAS